MICILIPINQVKLNLKKTEEFDPSLYVGLRESDGDKKKEKKKSLIFPLVDKNARSMVS